MNELLKFELIDLTQIAEIGLVAKPPACGGCGGSFGDCNGGGCGGDSGNCRPS